MNLVPVNNYGAMKSMSVDFIKSGLLPSHIKTPEQACLIMLKGAEIDIPAIHALEQIYVVQGKTTMKAELMLAQVYKKLPTAKFTIVETSDTVCRILAARPGDEPVEFSYSIEDAKKAGDANKDQYKKRPATMLRWRCITNVCRSVFPDALMGVSYTPDELGAVVDDEGEPKVKADGGIVMEAEVVATKPAKKTRAKKKEPEIPAEEVYTGTTEQQQKAAAFLSAAKVPEDKYHIADDFLKGKLFTKDILKEAVHHCHLDGVF